MNMKQGGRERKGETEKMKRGGDDLMSLNICSDFYKSIFVSFRNTVVFFNTYWIWMPIKCFHCLGY